MVKDLGRNLLTGNIMRTAIPVTKGVFVGKSQLQVFSEHLLDWDQDFIVYLFKCLHASILCQRKPFNPIIGETLYIEVNGNKISCEQIQNHPTTCIIRIKAKDYEIRSLVALSVSLKANGVLIQRSGITLVIRNEKIDAFSFPDFKVQGLFTDERQGVFQGESKVWLDYKGPISSIQNLNDISVEPTFVIGFSKNGQIKCDQLNLEGDFVSGLKYKQQFISFNNQQPEYVITNINKCQSDCLLRHDIQLFLQQNYKEANNEKLRIEEIQRNDRKFRD
eukprot:EST45065.1 Oxysterol binding family protein [Spironucleus salmonicida]